MKPISEIVTNLGNTRCRPPRRLFGIKRSDRLFHQYVIGQTGTGKSTLLQQMMLQDYANGQGFCLIDPHGDLAETVVRQSHGVLYWNASDPKCHLGYNPLTMVSEQFRPLVASSLIDALKKQWSDAWGPRMEHLLRYSILALLERPNSTLRDIIPMFLDRSFRFQVLSTTTDEQVRWFWQQEFPNLSYRSAADGVAPVANKLGAFLSHPLIRKSLCEPEQPLRFREIIDQQKTLIVNLSKGSIGADVSEILGGLIVSKLAHAALSRRNIQENARRPYFAFIDEFHSFTTKSIADMLSELRKFKLGLVLAHQHTSQLDSEVLESIWGNVGTLMSFRVGATDAPKVCKQFGYEVPTPQDLVNLRNYDLFIKLMVDGGQTKVFSARTTAPEFGSAD